MNVSFESSGRNSGGRKERGREKRENGWVGSGGSFEGDAGINGGTVASG